MAGCTAGTSVLKLSVGVLLWGYFTSGPAKMKPPPLPPLPVTNCMLQAPNLLRCTIEASIRSTPVDRSLNSSIDAQLHSTLDLLHDVLFNSTIYRQAERSDPTEVLTKISGWRGIAEYHPFEATIKDLQVNDFEAVSKQTEAQAVASKCTEYQLNRVRDYSEFTKFASAKQQQALDKQAQQSARDSSRKNAAATEYLRISRALEAAPKSASVIRKIAALLGSGKVSKGRSIGFGIPVKLVPLTAAQAVECLSLFLIWPRELSLYAVSDGTNSRVASSVLEFFETQVVSSKPGFTLKGAHYTNADAGSPCCCLCSKESHFLVDGKQCARCILLTHFHTKSPTADLYSGWHESPETWLDSGLGFKTMLSAWEPVLSTHMSAGARQPAAVSARGHAHEPCPHVIPTPPCGWNSIVLADSGRLWLVLASSG